VQEPVILPTAYKHGIAEDDMLHAYRVAFRSEPDQGDHSLTMLIGMARNGVTVLEIGVAVAGDQPFIVHADDARKKYL
jgi:hypothetical protein